MGPVGGGCGDRENRSRPLSHLINNHHHLLHKHLHTCLTQIVCEVNFVNVATRSYLLSYSIGIVFMNMNIGQSIYQWRRKRWRRTHMTNMNVS